MTTTTETGHHTFVSRALPFEPAIENPCSATPSICRGRPATEHGRPTQDRRPRPFPRSLGTRHQSPHAFARAAADPAAAVPDDARRGAEQGMRLLLEVLDRRRPAEKLGALFAPAVVESVKTIVRTHPPGHRLGSASLRRVHVARTAPDAAEIFGTYARGPRVFAVAARLEYRSGSRRSGWTITSLRVC
ncbi:MAG: Rv3235 family protein [Rhodococcus sp. (in: high G+C Gram-positive bacteria)]